jgi:hypothetical protein
MKIEILILWKKKIEIYRKVILKVMNLVGVGGRRVLPLHPDIQVTGLNL